MNIVNNITTDVWQQQQIPLVDGTLVTLQLKYSQNQLGWFIPLLTYGSFKLCGMRVVNSPNMLHQYRNEIPFGLACFSVNDREPGLVTDFINDFSNLYILTAADVAAYTTYLSNA
jgi:hypothetical protein